MSRTGLLGLGVVFLSAGVLLLWPALARQFRQPVESQPLSSSVDENFTLVSQWLTRYTLTERSGRKFDSAELVGQVHVVNFFFTACPTACPLQTQKVQALDKEYGLQGVRFLSISCDPDTDTPDVLRKFALKYEADPQRWLFLTGDFNYIRRVAAEMYWSPLTERGHREDLVVVDKWGAVRGNFAWNDSARIGELKKLLDELLLETEPPSKPTPVAQPIEAEESTEPIKVGPDDAAATEVSPTAEIPRGQE